MRAREDGQISFDDLLGVPAAGEIVERHGRRLTFAEAAARTGEIVILNISTENHEWFRAVRVLRTVTTPDGVQQHHDELDPLERAAVDRLMEGE